jgi:hypothetical protein
MGNAVIDPDSIEASQEACMDLAIPREEKDRIDQLLNRYDSVLAQAEDLSAQIESLLKEWNPAPSSSKPPTAEDASKGSGQRGSKPY